MESVAKSVDNLGEKGKMIKMSRGLTVRVFALVATDEAGRWREGMRFVNDHDCA